MKKGIFAILLLAFFACKEKQNAISNARLDAGSRTNNRDSTVDSSDNDLNSRDSDKDTTDVKVNNNRSSWPAPLAEVLKSGSKGILLRGVVLASTGILNPGEVLIINNIIKCVANNCSQTEEYSSATIIDTHGIISPSLIDTHNHIAFNFLPEWYPDPPRFFDNRYQWQEDEKYEEFIKPYTENKELAYCLGGKWSELRSILHGTTTVQGEVAKRRCLNRLARNAEHYHGLGSNHMQTYVFSPANINDLAACGSEPLETCTQRAIQGYVGNFRSGRTTRLVVHMAEGISGTAIEREFNSFAGRDTRQNRHQGVSLLAARSENGYYYQGTGLLIHSLILTEAQITEAEETRSSLVWSPSSNIALYNQTMSAQQIRQILDLNITMALAPDWTPSGEDEMLSELRFAQIFAKNQELDDLLTPERLWQMATIEAAKALDLAEAPEPENRIGVIATGYRADIVVFGRNSESNFYQAIIDSYASDVRLVLIDGAGYYGDLNLRATAVNEFCDTFHVCGKEKFICARNTPKTVETASADEKQNETIQDIHKQLIDLLARYGRQEDLLALVTNCSASE